MLVSFWARAALASTCGTPRKWGCIHDRACVSIHLLAWSGRDLLPGATESCNAPARAVQLGVFGLGVSPRYVCRAFHWSGIYAGHWRSLAMAHRCIVHHAGTLPAALDRRFRTVCASAVAPLPKSRRSSFCRSELVGCLTRRRTRTRTRGIYAPSQTSSVRCELLSSRSALEAFQLAR
ncbi:hypothetical protein C8Q76DRAFT_163042 [Earliella scabrosa]|nr:hypothetical protein C8Q76DRAFT_163042 [Earliella scabrosa]